MTAPRPGPRPVGPPPPPAKPGPVPGAVPPAGRPAGGPWSSQAGAGGPFEPPRTRVYTWSSGWSSGWSDSRRRVPWLAILLIVLGVGLLIELLVPDLSFGSLLILAAGLAFGAVWLVGHVTGATMPALVLTAWGAAGIGTDLGILTGEGWTTLLVGIAFLLGWALARSQRVRRDWALVLGAVLGLIGLADVSDTLALDLDAAVLIPLVLIGVGIYLIARDRLPGRT